MFFITYAKNFFVPPSDFGIGSPTPIRSFENALAAATGNRNTVVFVNNGHTGGDIERVIESLSNTVRGAGKTAVTLEQDVGLLTTCASSLRGASTCFGAVSFHSSPSEGDGSGWNYTIRADGTFGIKVYVKEGNNDVQVFILPFQSAVDRAIASLNNTELPSTVDEYQFTTKTQEERDESIRISYMGALIDILAVALYIGVCGVTYQLTGQMASERETGISQLVEAMSPAKRPWHTQAARLLSNHIAFDIIYLPGWIIMGIIVRQLAFVHTNVGILIIYHILVGAALTSFSIFGASFFRKAQLSGITMVIIPIILAIIAQVAGPYSTGAVAVLSLLFPSMNYVWFITCVARWERTLQPANLVEAPPDYKDITWTLPGIAFWIFCIVQIFVYPVCGAFVERWLYGTVSKERKTSTSSPDHSIILTNFSKHWTPSWFRTNVLAKIGIKPPETVYAVNDFSIKARRGQIMVLLGANGSGKSTTLDAISGLNTITEGSIEINGTGGLGLCPQKNVMWDELTVLEHVQIFNRLKSVGTTDNKETIVNLIKACDLGHKLKAQSKTLSGGQKRKLQLAMMFTGGSRVCCVDEVSSGLDPLSRRKIWEILLSERGDRTFLLTTHFLDEVSISQSEFRAFASLEFQYCVDLADRLSNSRLTFSLITLRSFLVVTSRLKALPYSSSTTLEQVIMSPFPKIHQSLPLLVFESVCASRSFKFKPTDFYTASPSEAMQQFWFADALSATKFIDELRSRGVKNYDIVGPTLEDVFLALAEEVKEHHLDTDGPTPITSSPKNADVALPASDQESEEMDKNLQMSKGKGTTMVQQTLILIRKRITILRRNYWPYVCAVLLPIIAAGLVTLFLKDYKAVGCRPGEATDNPDVYSLANVDTDRSLLIPVGPPSRIDVRTLAAVSGLNASNFQSVDTLSDFNNFIDARFHNVTPGGFFLQDNGPPVMAYVGNVGVLPGLVTLSTLDSVLSGIPISAQYQQFAVPFAPSMGKTLQLILYFGLAMSVYPAFFALYPTIERLRKVRALHYSNGIRAAPLWLAYLIFDFCFVLVISAIVTGIFVGVR